MLIDTSSLPGLDDPAPRDDSGGEQKEKRPGGKDQGDEMESDNDTESNANIIAPDAGNINNNGDKYGDFAQKMIAIAKRKRAAANDGWKQHENVPPAGIQGEIKKSDSGIAVREGKEFRLRDDLVIESREITQPEATERHETHEDEQSQGQQETVSENVVKATKPVTRQRKSQLDLYYESTWCNGLAVEGACRALRAKRISSATTRSVLMILAENAHQDEDGLCVEMAQTVIAAVLKVKQSTVSKAIGDLKEAGLIGRVDDSYTVGTNINTGKAIRYRMLFSVRG